MFPIIIIIVAAAALGSTIAGAGIKKSCEIHQKKKNYKQWIEYGSEVEINL
jgi:hypothetical protein